MFRKISLALMVLMAILPARRQPHSITPMSASMIPWWTSCPPVLESEHLKPLKAPEIDPASAMAGLTMLAGGLAVLRGRRRINPKD